jgi:flagellar biosynthesis chaperone FliJ
MIQLEKKIIDQLIDLGREYSKIHSEMNQLESNLISISTKREELSKQLNYYRSLENDLINKIEIKTGQKVTADYLREILK